MGRSGAAPVPRTTPTAWPGIAARRRRWHLPPQACSLVRRRIRRHRLAVAMSALGRLKYERQRSRGCGGTVPLRRPNLRRDETRDRDTYGIAPQRPGSPGRARVARLAGLGDQARRSRIASRVLLRALQRRAAEFGISLPYTANTPYINTIPRHEQPRFPGNREIERRIKSIIRWNAMAMVVRANRDGERHRRPHLDLRLGRHAVRGRLQPLLPRHGPPRGRRPGLLPGPRLAGHLRPRLSRGPPRARSSWRTSAASCGPAAASPPIRTRGSCPTSGSSPPSRWAWGRSWPSTRRASTATWRTAAWREKTGRVWAFLGDGETDEPETLGAITPGRAREAGQPDLRHQLQPAAAGRPGARQRQDHPGAGGASSAAPAGT